MKLRLLHCVAWTLGMLIHVDGRPLGYAPPAPANSDLGLCGGLSSRER